MIQEDSSIKTVRNTTQQLENAIMDSFFNKGFIITNEPILVADSSNEQLAERYASAENGNVSFIIPVTVSYQNGLEEIEPDFEQSVASVDWEILSARLESKAKGHAIPNAGKKNTGNRTSDIQIFSEKLVSEIDKTVNKL